MNVPSLRSFVQVRFALTAILFAGVTTTAGANPERERCGGDHSAPGCVRPLNDAEADAVRGAARALVRHDVEACRRLGAFVIAHVGDARMVPYPIRTPYGSATGDAHRREQPVGSGRVHVSDSVLVRDVALARPLNAKISTLVHDFAHLALELPQEDLFLGEDLAGNLAARCLGQ